jgi:hypothetical protein
MAAHPGSNQFGTPDNSVGTLNGLFKEVYADKMKDLIPDGVKLLNLIRFSSKEKSLGNLFHCPIVLGMEHGVTFASSDADAFSLQPAIAGSIKDAQVRGAPMVLRSVLGYVAASRAQAGKEAFMDATKFLVSNMLRSMSKKLEIEMIYGQVGYGIVDSVSGTDVTIVTAEWAPGIWAGAESMPLEFYTGASLSASATVASVNLETRKVSVSGVTGTISAGDVIFHKGAYGNEFAGVHKILTQSTGTLFNINVASYNLFKGNEYSAAVGGVAAPLSFTKINLASARAVEKGLDSKLTALVNPRAWANILSDQAALRRYDGSYSSAEVTTGAKSVKFFSQNGEIEIVPSIYVKEGYAYLIAVDDWSRVGSSDITFKRPGKEGDFFRDLENSAGYELRCMTDQALFCNAPGRSVLIKDIENAA